ncbi:Seed biotin-containing protein SBP65 [Spatholobus suberectus]|nr:Seed biotin-containing protein SBP65 [Spatholobus suberectus]
MASEQLARRENTTTEREIHVEKDRVPKMATHFKHLAEQGKESDVTGGKETPQGSIEALQGGEQVKEHAGKAIGDVGGRGKGRETHELGAHFESLADKVNGEDHKENLSARAANVVGNKEGGRATTERESRGGGVGKFEMKNEGGERGNKDREALERQTREVTGRVGKERESGGGQLVADKGTTTEEAKDEDKLSRRVGAENEGASATTVITCTLEKEGNAQKPREESESSTWEQISNYRDQAQKSAKERYERAKQAASETLNNTTQTARGKDTASQAKDATLEKGRQGYAATKDTISSAAKTASEKTAPVAEKAKGYTLQAAEKAKSAGGTTASYVGEKAAQAKDVTVESGKGAAEYAVKVAADLNDKTQAAARPIFRRRRRWRGPRPRPVLLRERRVMWDIRRLSLRQSQRVLLKAWLPQLVRLLRDTPQGRKRKHSGNWGPKKLLILRFHIIQLLYEAEERPSEGIGETVSQYAQKPKPGGGSSQQEGTGSNVGEKVKKPLENIMGGEGKRESGNDQSGGQEQGKGIGQTSMTSIGEKLGDAKQMEELLDNITEGGGEVVGAVGETVAEIGQNMMKPAERVQEHGQEVQEGGVLSAIGETISEIAETTKVIVTGEDERVLRQSVGSESRLTDRAKNEGSQSA